MRMTTAKLIIELCSTLYCQRPSKLEKYSNIKFSHCSKTLHAIPPAYEHYVEYGATKFLIQLMCSLASPSCKCIVDLRTRLKGEPS
jgi:hypothetical protein